MKLFDHGKRTSLRRLLTITSALILCLLLAAGCASGKDAVSADHILSSIDNAQGDILDPVEGNVIVYSSDLSDLKAILDAEGNREAKVDLAIEYINNRDRVDCILEDINNANIENIDISCSGIVVVQKEEAHGLEGVSSLLSSMPDADKNNSATRALLIDYLSRWSVIRKVTRVQESLKQMERSRNIPLFGKLVKSIHTFPILYQGHELVPADEINDFLIRFGETPDSEKRSLVHGYLDEKHLLN